MQAQSHLRSSPEEMLICYGFEPIIRNNLNLNLSINLRADRIHEGPTPFESAGLYLHLANLFCLNPG
jgi:hypothetical protein